MSGAVADIDAYETDRNTHFLFDHKVFHLKGARFALTGDGSRPALHIDLGDLTASLPIATLYTEFQITPDSSDGVLLAIVEKSLRYVKEIWPGDSIPRELLDGTASWSVEERHRLRAKALLWARSIGSDATRGASDAALRAFLNLPENVAALQTAAAEIAETVGPPLDAESVVSRIEGLARELAYIEALKERCGEVLGIVTKVNELARVYRSDRGIVDELSRIRTLMLRPTEHYNGIFVRFGKAVETMVENIAHYHDKVDFIRAQRDDLHQGLMVWDPVLAAWDTIEIARCAETEAKMSELYRFVARHFLTAQSWQAS